MFRPLTALFVSYSEKKGGERVRVQSSIHIPSLWGEPVGVGHPGVRSGHSRSLASCLSFIGPWRRGEEARRGSGLRHRRRRKVKRSIHAEAASASLRCRAPRRAVPFKAFPPPSLPPMVARSNGAGPPAAVSIRRLICLSFVIHVNGNM